MDAGTNFSGDKRCFGWFQLNILLIIEASTNVDLGAHLEMKTFAKRDDARYSRKLYSRV